MKDDIRIPVPGMEHVNPELFNDQRHLESVVASGITCRRPLPVDMNELSSWRATSRDKLGKLLGLDREVTPPVGVPQRLAAVPRPGYSEELWSVPADDNVRMNVFLLVPDTVKRGANILALHGHGPGVQWLLGRYRSPEEETARLAKDADFAPRFARMGYVVCAPELNGFGWRSSDGRGQDERWNYTCRHHFLSYLMRGRVLQGERIRQVMRVIDWLLADVRVDSSRFAITGQSGGGTVAMYMAALDDRARCVVPASTMSAQAAAFLSNDWQHCLCNYIPDMLSHFDAGEVMAMAAPTPLCMINGERDVIFPIQEARQELARARQVYALHGAADRLQHAIHPDEHRYRFDMACEFMLQWNPV